MEKISAIFGIYLLFLMGSVWSQTPVATVSVNEDTMREPNGNITLNCIGDNGEISFYIRNRVAWTFTNVKGEVHQLSFGFYEDTKDEHTKTLMAENRFKYKYQPSQDSYVFSVFLDKLKFSDDGEYTCTLYDEGSNIISQKTTKLTVASPVKNLRLTLESKNGDVISRESFQESDTAVKLSPGHYMVKCTAMGSNPEAKMMIMYNDKMEEANQTNKLIVSGGGPTYNSTQSMQMLHLKSMELEQLLMCEANVEKTSFAKKRAGIKMLVQIDKPNFKCSNLSTAPGERYRKIECMLITKQGSSAPVCNNVFWKFGEKGDFHTVENDEKYTDKNQVYNIVQSQCVPVETGLKVTLTIFTMNDAHMKTTFYIMYGIGNDSVQHPITITKKDTSACSVLSPLGLLFSLLMAVLGRHVSRSL